MTMVEIRPVDPALVAEAESGECRAVEPTHAEFPHVEYPGHCYVCGE